MVPGRGAGEALRKPRFLLRQAARTLPSTVRPFFSRLRSAALPRQGRFGLNAPVRVTTGTVAAVVIVIGAIVLGGAALWVRPPPPSQRAPGAGGLAPTQPASTAPVRGDGAPHLVP